MIEYKNEDLSKHVTMRIGGIAKNYYIPESIEELSNLVKTNKEYGIISGGSNLLINDRREYDCVIDMKKCNLSMYPVNDRLFYIGASVRIQKVIKYLQGFDKGGFEFLYSLPALFGGVVYMNAGRGLDKKAISLFVKRIYYLDEEGNKNKILVEEANFSYRKSIFQDKNWVIVGAEIEPYDISHQESQKLVHDRIEHCKNYQDMRYPNFGSVFRESNGYLMDVVKLVSSVWAKNKKKGVHFSDKTCNWLINKNNGTFDELMKKVNKVKKLHSIFKQKCELEVRIWE